MADAVEASEHASFYTRNNSRARIPVTVQKKILAAYRTAYTTLICIIVISNYKFGGSATYVSPLLAAISGGSAYFGQWQNDAWKVTYAAIFGSAIGVAIGFSWHYNYVQIILLFSALTWSNRISLWDRLGKVIAAIGIVLGIASMAHFHAYSALACRSSIDCKICSHRNRNCLSLSFHHSLSQCNSQPLSLSLCVSSFSHSHPFHFPFYLSLIPYT